MPAAPLNRRLLPYIELPDGCWVWKGQINNRGYGRLKDGHRKGIMAHRAVYELLVGPIPRDLQLDHLCRNRACVNPRHLEPVTPSVNTRRGVSPAATRAQQTHCLRGHPLVPGNLETGRRWRVCSTCRRERDRIRRAARRTAA